MKEYAPGTTPISPTPAALPTLSMLPPHPAHSVRSDHCDADISGSALSTAYVIGMLSIAADAKPNATLATSGPNEPYQRFVSACRYPATPSPPTHAIAP